MKVTNDIQFFHPTTTPTVKKNVQESGIDVTERNDPVTLSPAARKILEASESSEAGKIAEQSNSERQGDLPLEMYAIPDWYAEYGFLVPTQLGVSGNWFAEKYPEAASTTEDQRNEYSKLVRGHYDALMDKHGIEGIVSHYTNTIVDKNSSESLRLEMADLVRNDPRLMELMKLIGKNTA